MQMTWFCMVMAGHFVEVGRIDLKVNTDKRKVVLSGGEVVVTKQVSCKRNWRQDIRIPVVLIGRLLSIYGGER